MGQALLIADQLSAVRAEPTLHDARGRTKRKLRLSLTDRCNLRCLYCMPDKPSWLPRAELMPCAEIVDLVRVFVRDLGITEIRLTGGEPLLRGDVVEIVRELDALRGDGLQRIAMTSNGGLLPRYAKELKAAGLDDLNISLDAIDPEAFKRLTRGDVHAVLRGISAAQAAGLPVKLNCVVVRDYNEDQILPLAHWAHDAGLPLRYIEFMPLDGRGDWSKARVVTEAQILEHLRPFGLLKALPRDRDPASYFQLLDGYRIGVISTISKPFCASCDRLRVDARGALYTCLFSARGHDLRSTLLENDGSNALAELIRLRVWNKDVGYVASPGYVERPITMHHLGG
ncbi:MAG: GTP 3',8-cyclase MoaA [Pseudomonadota bacterium]|nr:GTP 3',8-cyclase MoaA [Pseudomonadota bacterium]